MSKAQWRLWKCHCEIEMWLSRLLFAHVARQELTKYAEVAKTFETYLLSSWIRLAPLYSRSRTPFAIVSQSCWVPRVLLSPLCPKRRDFQDNMCSVCQLVSHKILMYVFSGVPISYYCLSGCRAAVQLLYSYAVSARQPEETLGFHWIVF